MPSKTGSPRWRAFLWSIAKGGAGDDVWEFEMNFRGGEAVCLTLAEFVEGFGGAAFVECAELGA